MLPLDDAADVMEAGGKARALARARRAGLPVLDGVVVLPGERVDAAVLAEALRRLGGERFAVRSSASVEDGERASAAGVFASEVGVLAGDVAGAIERVRRSAEGEPARAYLAARRIPQPVTMAVLVQPVARAQRLGVLHGEPRDGAGRFPAEERVPDEPEWGALERRAVDPAEPLGALAEKASRLVGGAVDLEYALVDGAPLLLQLRPLTAIAPSAWPGDPFPEGGVWRLDAEHNPAPLSAAQASLVALLDGRPGLPRMRLWHGYLYVCRDPPASPPPVVPGPLLARHFAEVAAAQAESLLGPLERAGEALTLDDALGAFVRIAESHFGQLSPSLSAARRALDNLLGAQLGETLAEHAALLGGSGGLTVARDQALWQLGRASSDGERATLWADYRRRFGASAPAWDVIEPPDDEEEARVLAAAALVARGIAPVTSESRASALAMDAARALSLRLPSPLRSDLDARLFEARAAAVIGEDDDQLFFRAQRLVRRALLARGHAAELDDATLIFELPITEDALDRGAAVAARAARIARIAAAALRPPRIITGGRPAWDAAPGEVLRGAGTPGRARGRVRLVTGNSDDEREAAGAVLVVAAILPSLTYLLPTAAALVTDHGGALSHGATLAREYGIPAVLGTGAATRSLRDGDEVFVDGDAGRVYRL